MTKQEFLKEFNRRKFYYQEFNSAMYNSLLKDMDLYHDALSSDDRSDFLREYSDISAFTFERIGKISFYDEIKSYAKEISGCMHPLFCEKMNAYLDELEKVHFINKSILMGRFLCNPKYKGICLSEDKTNDENLFIIANKYYEPDGLYDEAHKVYSALEDYVSARRVRYCQAINYYYKDDFENAKYYFQCALDYDDAQEYVEKLTNATEEYERFKREVPRDYLSKRLRKLQPELYDEYVRLYIKNAEKSKGSPHIRKKLSKLYDKLYEYVPELEEELIERYSDKVGEDIVLHWLGELNVIHIHDNNSGIT